MMPRMTRPGDISVSPMTATDLEDVLQVEAVSYPRPWTRAHFLDEVGSPYAFPLVARDSAGALCGYVCPTLLYDEAEIRNVAVAPACRGRGVGAILVNAVIDRCRDRNAASVWLEVRVSNMPARSLYRRAGFREAGRRPAYYENGEDALLMVCDLDRSGDD